MAPGLRFAKGDGLGARRQALAAQPPARCSRVSVFTWKRMIARPPGVSRRTGVVCAPTGSRARLRRCPGSALSRGRGRVRLHPALRARTGSVLAPAGSLARLRRSARGAVFTWKRRVWLPARGFAGAAARHAPTGSHGRPGWWWRLAGAPGEPQRGRQPAAGRLEPDSTGSVPASSRGAPSAPGPRQPLASGLEGRWRRAVPVTSAAWESRRRPLILTD